MQQAIQFRGSGIELTLSEISEQQIVEEQRNSKTGSSKRYCLEGISFRTSILLKLRGWWTEREESNGLLRNSREKLNSDWTECDWRKQLEQYRRIETNEEKDVKDGEKTKNVREIFISKCL